MAEDRERPEEPGTEDRGSEGEAPRERSDAEVDAAFAEIVAGWDQGPAGPDEVREDPTRPPGEGTAGASADSASDPWSAPPEGDPREAGGSPPRDEPTVIPVWRGGTGGSVTDLLHDDAAEPPDDDEVPFEPPPTQPLPPFADRLFWGALGGLVLGPALLLVLAVLQPGWGGWAPAVGIGLAVGGFVCLVLRQPSTRDDDPDQGARV
ncbi:hypothetical protein GCM10027055_11330 [Janibacter alkaliphilus]|uniref:DUF308 domain-containing protein n=1 Tax=Janibacter alkaliphilus TaxID=1069963 RepID=A0A852XAV7_9MICO|nr:hypothetical protein [Janibacter alkaliphilus]NYG37873.1 hypothetical protein [Janibacter alkaliphilus]